MSATHADPIVHDAEHYVLRTQHGDRWELEDKQVDATLAELRDAHGGPPNIIHIMWDDMAFGDAGIPIINALRGFETPSCNRMAQEGIMFGRMYTETACTPSRAAVITGRHAIRNGMHTVAFPIENNGLSADEETMAEVLSNVGYATAFYGKWHLGDIEECYPHNQGFDETLFVPYNQVLMLYNDAGERANAVVGARPDTMPEDRYQLDDNFVSDAWLMAIEGRKGELGKEYGNRQIEDWGPLEAECKQRTLDFVRRNAEVGRPFYAAYWPNESTLGAAPPAMEPTTAARTILSEKFQNGTDAFLGELMDLLIELGIAENTLLVAHADNGPMTHNPPPGLGNSEIMFRGGKGDYWEGAVRVPAFAWWPGTIAPGQVIGDMIHETDLFTTFARLAGATEHIPRDRIIDGIDQTSLLLNGDTYSRRDYNFIYTGPIHAATVKGRFKRIWVGDHAGGFGAAFYDLYTDPREMNPQLVPLLHTSSSFSRMKKRHEIWKQKYPDKRSARGVPFTGIENPRPETAALSEPPVELSELPFNPLEYIDWDLPWDGLDPDG